MRFTLTAEVLTLEELEALTKAAREAGAYDSAALGEIAILELEWEFP